MQWVTAALVVALAGCTALRERALPDAASSRIDVGPPRDGGPSPDAGPASDGGPRDTGAGDAGPLRIDSGPPDTGTPDTGACVPTTEDCTNGRDDDCDGRIDCEDDDRCAYQPCGASSWQRCCGNRCRDFRTESDASNCSTCGFACAPGQACRPVNGFPVCTCSTPVDCPGGSGFACTGGHCSCLNSEYCGGGQDCIADPGGSGRFFCGYY